MGRSLVLGAGQIGGLLARRLAERGDDVTVGTRSGTAVPGATSARVDAADAHRLTGLARGADTVYVCVNPPYPDWTTRWPPIVDAVVRASRDTGASLVLMGNLYAYGAVTGPMHEADPLGATEAKGVARRRCWERVLAAHRRGEIRAVEVRASDYFGPGAGAMTHLGARFFEPLLAGRTAWVVGDPDAAHSWSYLPDIVTTLVAAADHTGEWGRAWHVPSTAYSRREIAGQVAGLAGVRGRVRSVPPWLLRGLGVVNPMARELHASSYQFTMPFVVDSTDTERRLAVRATPWPEALAATAASYRS